MHTDELMHQWKSEFSGMKSLTCKKEIYIYIYTGGYSQRMDEICMQMNSGTDEKVNLVNEISHRFFF
jgi:hypothetical protein